jgi:CBS domain-containing protein
MNREILAVRPDLPVSAVRELLRTFGVGAAPVLDDARRPLGVLSVRDVLEGEGTARERMTRPAVCVSSWTPVDKAARTLAGTDMHHLVVVDGSGAAAGMLSALDLLRELLGMPARHPGGFPHWDEATRTAWTDDWALDRENLGRAHDGPGMLILIKARSGERDEVVWVEECANTRARIVELSDRSMQQEPALTRVLALSGLRFRAASVRDEVDRARIAALLRDRLDHVPPVGAT